MKKQNTLCLGLVTLFLAGIASAGSSLILDEKDELAEQIEVQSYDGRKEKVKVRAGTAIVSQPLSSFSQANQKKIIGWHIDKKFKSSSALRVSVDQKKEKGNNKKYGREITRLFYELKFENRVGVELNDIQVTCLSFYKERASRLEDETWIKYKVEKSFDLNLAEGETQCLIVEPMDDYVRYYHNGTLPVEVELHGIHVCVHRTDRFGERQEKIYTEGKLPRESKWSSYKKL